MREGDSINAHSDDFPSVHYMHYIAKVLAAISELQLESEFRGEVPQIEDVTERTYQNFSKDVGNYVTRLKIRHGRRTSGFSVAFDSAAKVKIHHLIQQLREFFQSLEIDDAYKGVLMKRLNALAIEVDRSRTSLEAFGELTIEVAAIVGVAAEKLEPAKRLLDSVARVIWGSRQDEAKQLPRPEDRKQIEHKPKPRSDGNNDDEVPF